MEALFVHSVLRDAVLVKPHMLGGNYRDVVLAQLRREVEGRCTRHGYVLPGSVALHRICSGRVEAVSLNGDVRFDAWYHARVLDPPVGARLPARIVSANKFGVLAHSGIASPAGAFVPVVESIVTKQGVAGAAPSEVDLASLGPGDAIVVEVLGKKYELHDTRIAVVGRALPASTPLHPPPEAPLLAPGAAAGARPDLIFPPSDDDAEAEAQLPPARPPVPPAEDDASGGGEADGTDGSGTSEAGGDSDSLHSGEPDENDPDAAGEEDEPDADDDDVVPEDDDAEEGAEEDAPASDAESEPRRGAPLLRRRR